MGSTHKLYIMISRTHTGIGKVIRKFSGYPYNHVAMTLDPSFKRWVSFARYAKSAPFYGGFIVEPVERYLADGKGEDVQVRIFGLDVEEEQYRRLQELFAMAGQLNSGFVYNLFDIVAATVGAKVPIANAYTCLGFARAVLDKDYPDIKTLDMDLQSHMIYEGFLGTLANDTGDRSDMYFAKISFFQGTKHTLRQVATLTSRAVKRPATDTVTEYLH